MFVVVIEKDIINRRLVRAIIQKSHKRAYIVEVFDGLKAVDLIKEGILDNATLCFINLTLPEVEGRDVGLKLRDRNKKVRIIALTTGNESLLERDYQHMDRIIKIGPYIAIKKIEEEIMRKIIL